LVWAVLEQWPALASEAVAAPLNRWLGERDLGQRLDLASWQLARSIADAFDDYALYRPEMVLAWDQGQDVDGRRRPLGASQSWQPHLYRLLRRHLAREPFALRALAAIDRLRQPPSAALRARLAPFAGGLRLFGLSSLAPVQVQLLQALSAVLPVDLFLLTPCQDLWQRCVDRRQQLTDALALKEPLDLDWLLQAPGLEARFGRLGAEFQQLLEGTGEDLLARQQELDLFFLPVTAQAQGDSAQTAPPLLLQLQQQLADPANPCPLERSPRDTSLEFHGCPGPLRQVQIVRDRLLQLLATDPSLEPRDILVMTPAVDGFAPLLASVFGDREATGVDLPWRLTDRSQQSQAGIARTLLGLLRVAGDRFTATALEGLLEAQPLLARFGLTAPEVSELNQLLQRSGFRWGLDGRERGGDPTHSLAWVIDRLLLALVLPETPGLAPGGVAPAASGADLERTGRWLYLLTRLRHWLGQLRQPGTSAVWAARLREMLLDLFGDGGEAASMEQCTLGLITLRDVVMHRQAERTACLTLVLRCTVHADDVLRGKAIRMVVNQLHPLPFAAPEIESFASERLESVAQLNSADAAEPTDAPDDTEETLRRISLYFALCTRADALLPRLFKVYAASGAAAQPAFHRNMVSAPLQPYARSRAESARLAGWPCTHAWPGSPDALAADSVAARGLRGAGASGAYPRTMWPRQ
jgi:exodeoxyribonuclease V gamma subunit